MAAPEPATGRSATVRARMAARTLLATALAAVPVLAGLDAAASRPTLGALAPLLRALRSCGGWLGGWWADHGPVAAAVAAAVALAAVAVWAARRPRPQREAHAWAVVWSALLVALAAASSGRPALAVVAAVLAAVLAVFDLDGVEWLGPVSWWPEILLGILLLGAVLRFGLIAEHPVGFGTHGVVHLGMSVDVVDEILAGGETFAGPIDARRLLVEQHGPMAVVNALGFLLFGVGFVQARLFQAALGVAVVGFAFLVGRRLVGDRLGLVLGFMIAVSPWHVAMSRFNDAEHVLAALHGLLAVWAVLRADRERTAGSVAVAAVACALGWYVYATNQFLIAALVVFVAWRSLSSPRRLRRRWASLVLFALVFAAISLPHLRTSFSVDHPVPIRSGYQIGGTEPYSTAATAALAGNLEKAAAALLDRVSDPWYAKPSGGGLDVPVQVVLPAGLLWCLATAVRGRLRARVGLLLLWLGAGLLPAIAVGVVAFRRLLQLELALQVVAAVAVVVIGTSAARTAAGRRLLTAAVPFAILALTALASWTYWDRVEVPESEASTYWVALIETIRPALGVHQVVVVTPEGGELENEHVEAVRVGLYPELRRLARRGVPPGRAVRLVRLGRAESLVADLARRGPVLVAAASAPAGSDSPASRIEVAIGRLEPENRRRVVLDPSGRPALVAWELAAPSDPRDAATVPGLPTPSP